MASPTADEVLTRINKPNQSLQELKQSRDAVLEYRARLPTGHPYVQKVDTALTIANVRIAELSQESNSKGLLSLLKKASEHPIISGLILLIAAAIFSYFGIDH